MLHKLPLILLILVVLSFLVSPHIPLVWQQGIYTVGLLTKEVVVWSLPLFIFCLMFRTASELSGNVTKMVGMVLVFACCSNFISTFLSHYVGEIAYSYSSHTSLPSVNNMLEPLWQFQIPRLVTTGKAMLAGIILGALAPYLGKSFRSRSVYIADTASKLLMNTLMIAVPVFVVGFAVKLQHDGTIQTIVRDYSVIFAFIVASQFIYLALVYFLLSGCRIATYIANIKAMLPAAMSGFATMSSAATMPLTISGAERNAYDKEVVRFTIPITTSIHLVGDCFAIPIMAYAVIGSFGATCPSMVEYLIFSVYFMLAKFSIVAVPGGGIIAMLPILEQHLGFTGGMCSMITALYIIFDPVITSANVLGNGALAKFIDSSFFFLKINSRKYEVRDV